MKQRSIKRIIKGYATEDGAGVKLIRVMGKDDIKDIDPFLMMDAFGSDNPKDYIKGFPMHPHRGIETITYLLEGKMEHRDSIGNSGSLKDGELQWMTAGSGILHEEMPIESKRLTGLQFWLNLPAKDKMTDPKYFPITPDMIKTIPIEGGVLKLIAGEFNGIHGVTSKFTNIMMMDITLESDAKLSLEVPEHLNGFVYVFENYGSFGSENTLVEQHSAALLSHGEQLDIKASSQGVHFILLAGEPLNEPIAWAGPIVMNTEKELNQAFWELDNDSFIK